jgi:hypothetical protein
MHAIFYCKNPKEKNRVGIRDMYGIKKDKAIPVTGREGP